MTIPEAPHTATFTLNEVDHPIVVYIDTDTEGNPRWRIRINDQLGQNRETVKVLLLDLNTFCRRWFDTSYGTTFTRMTDPPEGGTT